MSKAYSQSSSRKQYLEGIGSTKSLALKSQLLSVINEMENGYIKLSQLGHMFPSFCLKQIWKVLIDNSDCFVVDHPFEKSISEISPRDETVYVKAPITLCAYHVRKTANGKHMECDEDCGALHLCRSYLLNSSNACHFNHKKNKCMFGHNFKSDHNNSLLILNGLEKFTEDALRRLFRRPLSRSETTMPQVCIYYNKPEGKNCSRENCTALHICFAFINGECPENCRRNHRLETKQIKYVLDLFKINLDGEWTEENLKHLLQKNMPTRYRTDSCEDDHVDRDVRDDHRLASQPARQIVTLDSPTVSDSDTEQRTKNGISYAALKAEDCPQDSCSGCKALTKIVLNNKSHIEILQGRLEKMERMLQSGAQSGNVHQTRNRVEHTTGPLVNDLMEFMDSPRQQKKDVKHNMMDARYGLNRRL